MWSRSATALPGRDERWGLGGHVGAPMSLIGHVGAPYPTKSAPYSTRIAADSVAVKPLSPVQWNAMVPLSVATVENTMNGFAAIAG